MGQTVKLEVPAEVKADPTPAPAANIVDGPNGGVQVDPSLATPAGDKPAGERPAGLPEKFNSWEELAKSYGELEKKLGEPKPADKPAETPAAQSQPDAAQTEALTKQISTELATVAGGEDKLANVIEWAKVNLNEKDAAAYDAALDTGNVDVAKLALAGIVAQYDAANGTDPQLITASETTPVSGVAPYASRAEMIAAMSDKRYAKDPAYRAKVEARVYASPF